MISEIQSPIDKGHNNITIELPTKRVIERHSHLYTQIQDTELYSHYISAASGNGIPPTYPFNDHQYILDDILHDRDTVSDRCPACKMYSQESCGLGPDPLDYGTRYPHSHKYSFKHGKYIYFQGQKVAEEVSVIREGEIEARLPNI